MRAPLVLRGVVLGALLVALVMATRGEPGGRGEVLRLGAADSSTPGDALLRRVLSGEQLPALLVRGAQGAPTAAELEGLAAAARVAPLAVALPETLPRLRLEPLPELRAGRRAALALTIRGEPGAAVPVRLFDETGAVDSASLTIGTGGAAEAAFRIRPVREGWREWRVVAGADETSATTGAWVRAAGPPRVLLVSGPPSTEGRFIARALEEDGARVTAAIALGRGVRVGGYATQDLAAYDVVILLPGAELSEAQRGAVREFALERGGGVLDAGSGAVLPALGVGAGWTAGGEARGAEAPGAGARRDEARGDEIAWFLPAELASLPASPVRGAARRVLGYRPGGGYALAAADEAGPLLVLGGAGRGRVAALGLQESWRWRLEAGQVEGHREFWTALVEWLAGGLRDSVLVRLSATLVAPRAPVEVRVYTADDAAPPALLVTGPGGRTEPLMLAPAPDEPGALRATILPDSAGLYTIGVATEPTRRAFRAVAEGAAEGAADGVADAAAWARFALLAERSGGVALPAAELEPWVARWQAEHRSRGWWRARVGPLLFALIVGTALAEWLLRRLRGRA